MRRGAGRVDAQLRRTAARAPARADPILPRRRGVFDPARAPPQRRRRHPPPGGDLARDLPLLRPPPAAAAHRRPFPVGARRPGHRLPQEHGRPAPDVRGKRAVPQPGGPGTELPAGS
ncbi:MAG: hypothetical protein MZV70_10580 [Desulfobacterales bacterium]|nr:hypothetical protein [Desulfobacterales bacterium]